MTEPVVHPITGEVLPDVLEDLVEQERVVDGFLRSLHRHYSFRRRLRERIAELRGEADLPRPRWRTEKQQRVSECPRCGGKNGKHFPTAPEPDPFREAEEAAA